MIQLVHLHDSKNGVTKGTRRPRYAGEGRAPSEGCFPPNLRYFYEKSNSIGNKIYHTRPTLRSVDAGDLILFFYYTELKICMGHQKIQRVAPNDYYATPLIKPAFLTGGVIFLTQLNSPLRFYVNL